MGLRRGEIWWANLPPPTKPRPVLLLMRDAAYQYRDQAIVSPITRTVHSIPAEVPVGEAEGLNHDSVANLDTIITIDKRLLERRMGAVSAEKMLEVEQAIRFALDLR